MYIRISAFNEDIDESIKKAVQEAQKKLKNKLTGIVIDVRNNPGGLLDQAVAVSDLFLDKGESAHSSAWVYKATVINCLHFAYFCMILLCVYVIVVCKAFYRWLFIIPLAFFLYKIYVNTYFFERIFDIC